MCVSKGEQTVLYGAKRHKTKSAFCYHYRVGRVNPAYLFSRRVTCLEENSKICEAPRPPPANFLLVAWFRDSRPMLFKAEEEK